MPKKKRKTPSEAADDWASGIEGKAADFDAGVAGVSDAEHLAAVKEAEKTWGVNTAAAVVEAARGQVLSKGVAKGKSWSDSVAGKGAEWEEKALDAKAKYKDAMENLLGAVTDCDAKATDKHAKDYIDALKAAGISGAESMSLDEAKGILHRACMSRKAKRGELKG